MTEGAQQVAHTPGGWRAKPWSAAEYGVQTAWLHPDTKKPIHIAGSVGKSDAHLIAAAPMLLEGAQDTLSALKILRGGLLAKAPETIPVLDAHIAELEFAIAKALGHD